MRETRRTLRRLAAICGVVFVALAADCMSEDLTDPFAIYAGQVLVAGTDAPLDSILIEVAQADSLREEGIEPYLSEFHVTDSAGAFSFELWLRGEDPAMCSAYDDLDIDFLLHDPRGRVDDKLVSWPFCRDGLSAGLMNDLIVRM